jgi:hypothetical protein
VKGVSFPFDVRSFFAQGDLEIEILNQELPYPLPKGDFKTGVCSLVKENAEELIDLGNRTDSRGMVRSSLGFTSAVFVLDFYDALTTFAGIETLFHDSSELMLMERDLAEQVLRAKNSNLTIEDLQHVPFRRMVLEFSKPLMLYDTLEVFAVGFFVLPQYDAYGVVWYVNQDLVKLKTMNMTSMVVFMSVSGVWRTTLDDPVREILGLKPEEFGLKRVGGAYTEVGRDEDIAAYLKAYYTFKDDVMIKSRNIWDFITCRNIDYETKTRSNKALLAQKRFSHLSQKMGPRDYRVIKTNRREMVTEKGSGSQHTPLMYQQKIPGSFHKWIYCGECGGIHRHDLIGRECRNSKCGVKVGPLANLKIKKWWHGEYRRGNGPLRDSVWEVRKGTSRSKGREAPVLS